MTDQEIPLLMDEKRAARALSISMALLRKWRREGGGPAWVKLGRCVRYDLQEIKRYIEQNSSDGGFLSQKGKRGKHGKGCGLKIELPRRR